MSKSSITNHSSPMNSSIVKHPFGTTIPDGSDAVFCIIYSKIPAYLNYDLVPECWRSIPIPVVLCFHRWDGKIGFLGGKVDEGESLIQAVLREIEEESGWTVPSDRAKDLKEICTHSSENSFLHLFSLEVTEDELKTLLTNYPSHDNCLAEGSPFVAHFINYPNARSFDNFMAHNLVKAVKEEIQEFICENGWDKEYSLT